MAQHISPEEVDSWNFKKEPQQSMLSPNRNEISPRVSIAILSMQTTKQLLPIRFGFEKFGQAQVLRECDSSPRRSHDCPDGV